MSWNFLPLKIGVGKLTQRKLRAPHSDFVHAFNNDGDSHAALR
jgi:hypothetical protein